MSAGRASGHQPVVATGIGVAVALGVAAVAEAVARAVASGATARYAFVLCVLALCTTVPLMASPTAAAIVVTAATVLSLAVFRSLTVAGAVAEVVVLYRFGRTAAPNPTV
ncbi:MAG TPA: hypothetical protein VGM78_16735, partial [Ilumatobacteraceae bacterium]